MDEREKRLVMLRCPDAVSQYGDYCTAAGG